MSTTFRRRTAWLAALSLLLCSLPAGANGRPAGHIEGLVLGTDGRPAEGYRVVLVERDGDAVAESATGSRGLYTFADVEPGSYAMAIGRPDGEMAPVAAEPVRVDRGELVRRDVVLVEVDPARVDSAVRHYGLVTWWVSRTRGERAWTVIGIVGGIALLFLLLEDDGEAAASASVP